MVAGWTRPAGLPGAEPNADDESGRRPHWGNDQGIMGYGLARGPSLPQPGGLSQNPPGGLCGWLLAGGLGTLPWRAVLGEVLEGSALYHDGVGLHDPGVALDERDQVEQAPVAG